MQTAFPLEYIKTMKPTAYDSNFRCNNDGMVLSNEAYAVLEPIFQRWVDRGFSPREIFTIVVGCVSELMCFAVLNHRADASDTEV